MVYKNRSQKKRGGSVTLSEIQDAISLTNSLTQKLQKIQSDAETTVMPNASDAYGLESSLSTSAPESAPATETMSSSISDYNSEPSVTPAFKTDKNVRFSAPRGANVKLSYSRIEQLLKNSTRPDKAVILSKLASATTKEEVQEIINNAPLSFSNNSIGGKTKKHMKRGKNNKRGTKRH
jgi:hypothetical protein